MYYGNRNSWWASIPPVTKNLIIINMLIWLATVIVPGFGVRLVGTLGLHYFGSDAFNPAQIFTYMFLHDPRNVLHVLFNMFTLYMFGRTLEHLWGGSRFLFYYLVCGVGAALVQEGVWALTWQHDYITEIARLNGLTYDSAAEFVRTAVASGQGGWAANMRMMQNGLLTIGASGAVFGLLLGFAFVFPDMPLYLMFIPVPVKAKYMMIGYAVLEFFLGVGPAHDTIAHFAHLGGMLFGLILLLYWKHKGTLRGGRFY